ncbi:hypothetical protein NECAME_14882 [Necator americanus]|uniref:Uncharacterized protein n=1 Tax=Necator americanus TaxID=51031 RepID=W2SNJ3_NECAM|nr:hypothetical protein NECAME_14882 [Necator americanus]ETN70252.1 hypothetical protein NECAME_14882 [Necator americanus]
MELDLMLETGRPRLNYGRKSAARWDAVVVLTEKVTASYRGEFMGILQILFGSCLLLAAFTMTESVHVYKVGSYGSATSKLLEHVRSRVKRCCCCMGGFGYGSYARFGGFSGFGGPFGGFGGFGGPFGGFGGFGGPFGFG